MTNPPIGIEKKKKENQALVRRAFKLFVELLLHFKGIPSMDNRAASVSMDMASSNLALLQEYGKEAWDKDIAVASGVLELLRSQLEEETRIVDELKTARARRLLKQEKEIQILENDLFRYIRNNEKTLIQVKVLEKRAKDLY